MGMGTAVMSCLEKFLIFGGRATRAEFWWFYLFTVIAGVLAVPLEIFLETKMITTGVGVAFLLPTLAAGSRRLHDTGRPGWLLAIPFLALPLYAVGPAAFGTGLLFGIAVLVLLLCMPGQRGANRYGPDPKLAPDLDAF
ncbi:DUF805 domain-containing protein [Rhodobacteraceae bacterium 2CG4]|uniref:DUF805 domain-containing protein n=2 Tax=Halovulum marinum TaxID=2662447 RepID=A0A6L5Z4Q1_9RHOB|nr:DUF805 domain-containing protein [Halovulum marinum]